MATCAGLAVYAGTHAHAITMHAPNYTRRVTDGMHVPPRYSCMPACSTRHARQHAVCRHSHAAMDARRQQQQQQQQQRQQQQQHGGTSRMPHGMPRTHARTLLPPPLPRLPRTCMHARGHPPACIASCEAREEKSNVQTTKESNEHLEAISPVEPKPSYRWESPGGPPSPCAHPSAPGQRGAGAVSAVKRRPQPPRPGKGGGHVLYFVGSDAEPFSTLDRSVSCLPLSCTACMHPRTSSLPPFLHTHAHTNTPRSHFTRLLLLYHLAGRTHTHLSL